MKSHNSCVTEHDKYAKGATKPGGFASGGFFGEGEEGKAAAVTAPAAAPAPVGLEFLATRHPWSCSACGVTCTSQETLLGHAAGVKHRRRSNAAAKAAKKEGKEAAAVAAEAPATPAAPTPVAAAAPTPETKKAKKEPKWRKLGVAALEKAGKGGRLKVKALLAAVGAVGGDETAAALAAWKGSSKFVVEGKKVGLAVKA